MPRLKWPEYVDAVRSGAIDRYPERTTICLTCHAANPRDIVVLYRRQLLCPSCAPRDRKCVRCDVTKPLDMFGTGGGRVESVCIPCRKEMQASYYALKQRTGEKEPPATKRCSGCRRTLPQSSFSRDQRYADGLMSQCVDCRAP